jgi:undecaprenyl-phosphate 4-deoxy-4-formamido-L-arabinose transferase
MVGLLFTIVGVLVVALVVIRFVVGGNAIPGCPFLASIIAIFAAVQLLILGIIGEYVARMHFRVRDSPTYVVGESTDDDTVR